MIAFLLCISVLPFLMGSWILCFRKNNGSGKQEKLPLTELYAAGVMLLFAVGELAGCVVIKLDGNFAMYKGIFGGLTAAALCVCVIVGRKTLARIPEELVQRVRNFFGVFTGKDNVQKFVTVCLVLLVLLHVAGYFIYVPDVGSDVTAETVHVTDVTGTVFAYNPVTGTQMEHGVYPIYKLASLPFLYTLIVQLTGMQTGLLLFYVIPVWALLVSFALAVNWAGILFPERKDMSSRFLLLYLLLLTFGDYADGTFAYGLLHGAWKGAVVACAIAVPFGFCMAYHIFAEKQWFYGGAGVLPALAGFVYARPLFAPRLMFASSDEVFHEWALLFLAVLALCLVRERRKQNFKKREVICLAFVLFTGVIVGSPLTLLALAYVGTMLAGSVSERKKSRSILAGLAVIICLAGTVLPFNADTIKKQYIPRESLEVQKRIDELAAKLGQVCLVAPEAVMEQARILNAQVCLPYGKDMWHEDCNREVADTYTEAQELLYQQMKTDYLQPDTAAVMAKEAGCNLLVLREVMSEDTMRQGGWQQAEDVTGYAVYFRGQ